MTDAAPERYARVVVDSALPHLDRPFDYIVPPKWQHVISVGSRVRVPFAGQLLSAVVVELPEEPVAGVHLAAISHCAAIPSMSQAAIDLARAIAERYGGSLWDVLRLMVPPRVAAVESREFLPLSQADAVATFESVVEQKRNSWLPAGELSGEPDRTVLVVPPTADKSPVAAHELLAYAVAKIAAYPDKSALVVAPDKRSLAGLVAAAQQLGLDQWSHRKPGDFAVLEHDAGPTARFSAYLAAMHGEVRLALGTRAAALQPVPDLGLIAVWDDGSDALQDPHSPYPHARTAAAMRSQLDGADLLLAGFAPSIEGVALVSHGFAQVSLPPREVFRTDAPAVEVIGNERREQEGGSGRHWMPSSAWRAVRDATSSGPVAVVVPRAGYVTAVACTGCGTWPECSQCGGELGLARGASDPTCRDCGAVAVDWHCAQCHGFKLSAVRQGVEAIAEQIKRMAPGVSVHLSSGANGTLADLTVSDGIVVATPGALPAVVGGYAALVVVSANSPLAGGLGAELLAMRWWLNAAALVRDRASGGRVLLIGDMPSSLKQALTTWSPWDFALEAYEERLQLGLPPTRRVVALEGDEHGINAALGAVVGPHALQDHPNVTASRTSYGVLLLLPRGLAQPAVDALRELIKERSRAGLAPMRMRVDAPIP